MSRGITRGGPELGLGALDQPGPIAASVTSHLVAMTFTPSAAISVRTIVPSLEQ